MSSRALASLAVAATALAGAGTSSAATKEWFSPQQIGGDYVASPQAGMNENGGAFVLFARVPPFEGLTATFRPAGGDFTPSVPVPWLHSGGPGLHLVRPVYDSAGRLVLGWSDSQDASLRFAVHDPATAAWRFGTLVETAKHPGGGVLMQAGDGTVYAAWQEHHDINGPCCEGPYVAAMDDGRGFGPARHIGGPDGMSDSMALDASPTGAAALAWAGQDGYMTSVQLAGGTFSAPQRIPGPSVGITGSLPQVSIDAAGEALFAIKSVESRGAMQEPATHIVVTARSPDGTFSPPETLSTTDDTSNPIIAAGPRGEAIVGWAEGERENARLLVSVRGADGSFSEPVTLADGGLWRIEPQIGMDAVGNAIAVWAARDTAGWRIYAAHRAPFSGFGPARPVSAAGVTTDAESFPDPRLTVGGPGNAIVTWHRFSEGQPPRVEAAVFDVAPPHVPEFEVAPGAKAAAAAAARRRRIAFRWDVSEQSRVTIKIRRHGHTVRKLRSKASPGSNELKVRRRRLAAGRYKAVLRAKDRLGHRSKPRRDRFRLQPR